MRAKNKSVKTVLVLLGDPSHPDKTKLNGIFDQDDFEIIDLLKAALRRLKGYKFIYLSNHQTFLKLFLTEFDVDLVLNFCDEGLNNDPQKELHIPALLESSGLPYTGAGPQCLAVCYDKFLVRLIAQSMGIPVAEGFLLENQLHLLKALKKFPMIAKPNFGDGSQGITQNCVAYNLPELKRAVAEIRSELGKNAEVLVEEFLPGKDLSLGIIGNPPKNYLVLPVTEDDYSALPKDLPRICGFEAKCDQNSPYWKIASVKAKIPANTKKIMVDNSVRLFAKLGCRDYARFDWRLDARDKPKLLEVNPNCGWCCDGHLAKMAKFGGLSYSQMLAAILKATEERLGIR